MRQHKILLLGKDGQVGWELQRTLAPLGMVTACGRTDCDLAEADQVRQVVGRVKPDVIVNAAAYNAVDLAEDDQQTAQAVNATTPGILAEEALRRPAMLIHYSTDFVFDGQKGKPYIESDPTNPINAYGRSKRDGEQAVQQVGGGALVLRTSWVYSRRGSNFVTKVLDWARRLSQLRIVDDQVGSPTWARMLAEITSQLVAKAGAAPAGWARERAGLYHLGGRGGTSRYDWAQAILRYDPQPGQHLAQHILPASSAEFPTPARRPAYSVLNCDRFAATFGLQLPEWEAALRMALQGPSDLEA